MPFGTDPVFGEYWLTFPSGSRNIYSQFVTMSGNQYIFLTRKVDSSSNVTAFSYTFFTSGGATNAIRLDKVSDEDNHDTTFVYATNGYYSNLITEVHGPYGLVAKLAYDAQCRLTNLTDVVNLSSAITYTNNDGRISRLITPYGTNSFTYLTTNGATGLLVNELGVRKEFYLAGHDRANVLPTAPGEAAALNSFIDFSSTVETNLFDVRNTFRWGPRQYQNPPSTIRSAIEGGGFDPVNLTTNDFKLGWTGHWLRGRTASTNDTNVILSVTLSVERSPSPDTNGVTEGLFTWYDYAGKNDTTGFSGKWEYAPAFKLPITEAERLPGGDWEATKYARNIFGNATRIEGTYSVRNQPFTNNPAYTWVLGWRTNLYHYAGNDIDLLSEHFLASELMYLRSSNVFNTFHQVTTNYNALDEVTYFEYNGNHQPTKMTNAAGLLIDFAYDGSSFLSTIKESSAAQNFRTNTYTWENGLLKTHTDPRGSVTTNSWDALGRITQTADEAGTATFTYDKLDLVRTTDRMGFTNGFAYDGFRQLVYQTNANFKVTTYQYCDCGALDAVVDALNNTTGYSYDNLGRLIRTTFPDNSWSENAYDLLNRYIRTLDSAGSTSTNTYLLGGLLTIRQSALGANLRVFYDAEDRATNTMDGDGIMTVRTFDVLGRVISSKLVDYSGAPSYSPDWVPHTNSFGYSARGLIAYTNSLGQVTRYFYDELGRKTLETNANTEVTQLAYTPAGDLLTLTDAKSQITTWKYDLIGRVTNKADNLGTNAFVYRYDANGRMTNRWTPGTNATTGISTRFDFDANGNMILVDYPSSPDITLAYDALNRVVSMLDAVGTTTYSFTNWAIQGENGPWENDTVSYTYTNGMRAGLSLAQATGAAWTQGYGYDVNRRLAGITSPAGAFTYAYRVALDDDGEKWPGTEDPLVLAGHLIEGVALPGGSGLTHYYDVMGRLTGTYLKNNSGTTLNKHEYSYDDGHRRIRQTRTGGDYMDYTYDDIGQLKTAFGKESGGTTNRVHERLGYTYDAAGNLNYRTNNALVQTFNVDTLNQLTTGTRSGNMTVAGYTTADASSVTVVTNTGSPVTAIRYADRTFAVTNVPLLNGANTFIATAQDGLGRTDTNTVAVTLPATVGYLYDLNGNLRTNGTTVLTYDDENQLTQVVLSNATKSEFTYDGLMRRRMRKEYVWQNGAFQAVEEVRYVYDGNLVIQERHYNAQVSSPYPQQTVSYTRGLDLSGSLEGAGGISGLLARSEQSALNSQPSAAFYHCDAVGNVTALVNTNQAVVARYLYDPFGNLLAGSGPLASANTYRFSSKEAHGESGMVYYLYRSYEPSLQRWLNRDPIGEAGGLNLYGYVGNNSVSFYDPNGLAIGDWWDARTWFNSGFTESWSDQANAIGKTWGDILAGNWDDIANNYDDSTLGQAEAAGPGVHTATKVCIGVATVAVSAVIAAEAAGISTRIAAHGSHHSFGPLGRLPHAQLNWWRAGVKGSGGAVRIPVPPGTPGFPP